MGIPKVQGNARMNYKHELQLHHEESAMKL
jgi:hypothetical protein